MALNFSTPQFSFVQIGESDMNCAENDFPCLPVVALTDIQFQVYARVTDDDKADFEGYAINASITVDCDNVGVPLPSYTGRWVLVEAGYGSNPDLWVGYFNYFTDAGFSGYDVGQCFNIVLFKGSDSTLVSDCFDTCFQKVEETCFQSIAAYRNTSNAFDFDYVDGGAYNRVRLPFYLHSPVNAEEIKDYAKSDGSSQLISARIWKDYKLLTDWIPDEWLERLNIALLHNDLRITGTYSSLNQEAVIKTEKLEINWQEETIPRWRLGQGKTTIRLAAPRANVNSNCA